MDNIVQVLQLGTENWKDRYVIPENVNWHYSEAYLSRDVKEYDLVVISRDLLEEEVEAVRSVTRAYSIVATNEVCEYPNVKMLCDYFIGQTIDSNRIQRFLYQKAPFYFKSAYGTKISNEFISMHVGYKGRVRWHGNVYMELEGDFGDKMSQALFWRKNTPIDQGQMVEIWLEYEKEDAVNLALEVIQFAKGTVDDIVSRKLYSEEEIQHQIRISNMSEKDGMLFVAVHVQGKGKIRIKNLHTRISRNEEGQFLPGGQRFVLPNREEVFCYFNPGNWQPPLNVYFSGYKTWEGFEGYKMMKEFKGPFLLFTDSRLEGGNFYLGTEEYEKQIEQIIRKYIMMLGFYNNEMIFSGLSMGAFGALYYGCKFLPDAFLLGIPLASLGNVAVNERMNRPGGFPTSLDVLLKNTKDGGTESIELLNQKLWDRFDNADWSKTKFIISYMIEDDYDMDAYEQVINHLQSDGVHVYGRGIHGRHNDNLEEIMKWYTSQYVHILREDFGRKIDY